MAIGGGNITLRQIITEWANGLGPSQNLSSFRRNTASETAFCPTNYNTITTLPTSGNLSASSFRNTEAEADGSTILNGWFQPQVNFFNRQGQAGGSSIPPIDFQANGTYNRYNSSWQTDYTFDQGGSFAFHRAYSKKATLLQWVIGAQASITGTSATFFPQTNLHQAYNWREQNFRVHWNDRLHRQITTAYSSYNRLGNNSGAWDGAYVLPGLWTVNQWFQQPLASYSPTADGGFTITVPPGQIMFFTAYNAGADGNLAALHPTTVDSGLFVSSSCHWWYNCCVHQVYWNSTGTNRNIRWADVWVADKNGSLNINGMFSRNDSTSGHQVFFLNRTY